MEKPVGSGRRSCLPAVDILYVRIVQQFQCVARTKASFGSAIARRVEVKCSCRQAKRRIGENGQPGACGIWMSLRNKIRALR